MTRKERMTQLREETKDLTNEEIIKKYSDTPFMELGHSEQDLLIEAMKNLKKELEEMGIVSHKFEKKRLK